MSQLRPLAFLRPKTTSTSPLPRSSKVWTGKRYQRLRYGFQESPQTGSKYWSDEICCSFTWNRTYVIKVWANISDPALGHPVDNSVAFAAALASTSSASLSMSSSPSTPSDIGPPSNNGTVPESSSTSPNNNNTTPPSNSKTIIVVGVVGGVAFCALILLGFWLWRRRRHRKRKQEEGLIKVRDPFNVQDSTSTSALHGPQKKHWTTNANGRQFRSVSTTQRQDLRRERDALQAELQRINSEIRRQDGNRNDSGQLQDDTEPRMRDCLHRIQARMDILTSEMAQMNRLMVPPSYVRDEGPETRGHGTTGMQISSSHKPRKHL
ncbi:hypothetical protein D9758_014057 [Tetrapyrgos nigripes]|uniref:receptor protein-tyrosine kinase n=1 Tax=Tetrapyrgos nigripes TaxID=182062 RepID=A0A8H5CIS7_9AGAR|nr:hypothetical protein D9758_014057 [Tetrapyrgos nigripes]